MLLSNTVKAKSIDSLFTASSTGWLVVNISPTLSCNNMIKTQKNSPTTVDVPTATPVANLAPFPFPAPSSFATLTLCAPMQTKHTRTHHVVRPQRLCCWRLRPQSLGDIDWSLFDNNRKEKREEDSDCRRTSRNAFVLTW